MTEQEQAAHFDTFGFVCLRQAFSSDEMADITRAAERVWEATGSDSGGYFAERDRRLRELADDDRIHDPISRLLGPGDVVLFNQYLWHGLHGGRKGRRFLAFKFAARPTAAEHLNTLQLYSPNVFNPHEAFLNRESTRIRDMVKELPGFGEQHSRNTT